MRRTFLLAMIAVVAAGMFVPAATAATDDHRVIRLRGVIGEVGDHAIVLIVQRGDERHRVLINVKDRTRIKLNGERVRLGDLMEGDRAIVRAIVRRTRDGHRLVATHIFARRGDG